MPLDETLPEGGGVSDEVPPKPDPAWEAEWRKLVSSMPSYEEVSGHSPLVLRLVARGELALFVSREVAI